MNNNFDNYYNYYIYQSFSERMIAPTEIQNLSPYMNTTTESVRNKDLILHTIWSNNTYYNFKIIKNMIYSSKLVVVKFTNFITAFNKNPEADMLPFGHLKNMYLVIANMICKNLFNCNIGDDFEIICDEMGLKGVIMIDEFTDTIPILYVSDNITATVLKIKYP